MNIFSNFKKLLFQIFPEKSPINWFPMKIFCNVHLKQINSAIVKPLFFIFFFFSKTFSFPLEISFNEEYSKYFNCLLNLYLKDIPIYDHFKCKIVILSLVEQIKDLFKKISPEKKIIVQIYFEQHLDQTIFMASKFLWNQQLDQHFQYLFFQKNLFILILVFLISKE